MYAAPGDWLVARSSPGSATGRRGAILVVPKDGKPPYTVRWADTGRVGIVFPGPFAEIVSGEAAR